MKKNKKRDIILKLSGDRMKLKKTILFLFITLILANFAFAANTGLLGGLEGDVLTTVGNILNFQIPIHASQLYGYSSNNMFVPIWALFAVFGMLFSVLWLASGNIPLFKTAETKGPRKMFIIALSMLTMFTTPIIKWILNLITAFTGISIVLLLVLGGYTVWTIFMGGWRNNMAQNRESRGTAQTRIAAANSLLGDAQIKEHDNLIKEQKLQNAMNYDLNNTVIRIRDIRGRWRRVAKDLSNITTIKGGVTKQKSAFTDAYNNMREIINDSNKIINYETEVDTLIKTDKQYGASLKNVSEEGTALANLTKQYAATMTVIIGEMRQLSQKIDPALIKNVISYIDKVIQITEQMERAATAEEYGVKKAGI